MLINSKLDLKSASEHDVEKNLASFLKSDKRNYTFAGISSLKKPVAGIAESAALYRAYEQAGGEAVQEEAVRWWQVFGSLRWTVINIMQVHGHRVGGRRSPAFAACGRNTALIEHELLLGIASEL